MRMRILPRLPRPAVAVLVLLACVMATGSPAQTGSLLSEEEGTLLAPEFGTGQSRADRLNREGYYFPKRGTYRFISFQVGRRTMGGSDFDGETFYTGDNEIFFIPEIEDAMFYGVYFDLRSGILGGGLGYSYAQHDWSWGGEDVPDAKVKTHFIDFDFRIHVMSRQAFQPFALLGFSFNGIQVEDGRARLDSETWDDLSMWGVGLNYGVGADWYHGRKVKVSGGARWHWDGYNKISGNELDEGLQCNGVNLFLSVGIGVDS